MTAHKVPDQRSGGGMIWNYRIIEFPTHRALHEVYYDGRGRPEGYTENPVSFTEEPDESGAIQGELELALKDIRELPVLEASVFDLPIEQRPKCERRAADA